MLSARQLSIKFPGKTVAELGVGRGNSSPSDEDANHRGVDIQIPWSVSGLNSDALLHNKIVDKSVIGKDIVQRTLLACERGCDRWIWSGWSVIRDRRRGTASTCREIFRGGRIVP